MTTDQIFNDYIMSLKKISLQNKLHSLIFEKNFKLALTTETNSADAELKTLEIQSQTLTKAKVENYGFDESIKSLLDISPSTVVVTEKFESDLWGGRVIYNFARTSIIGIVLVERPTQTKLRTPPIWDGSREMLEKFNRSYPEQ